MNADSVASHGDDGENDEGEGSVVGGSPVGGWVSVAKGGGLEGGGGF